LASEQRFPINDWLRRGQDLMKFKIELLSPLCPALLPTCVVHLLDEIQNVNLEDRKKYL
jgi:hypothetical protein